MAKFRKKPVVIEAFQFDGPWSGPGIPQWYTDAFQANEVVHHADHAIIDTLEGGMKANKGDWIIRGVADELYPCRDEIFRATYEPVE